MLISQILRRKGGEVFTARPDSTVAEVIAELAARGVGALVVSGDGSTISGIVSERDIVRSLASHGPDLLATPVSQIMTSTVITCDIEATSEELMSLMTRSRFRHVPVVDQGRLIGVVSIGDVVNARVGELENEKEHLESYISGH
ncbi:MAG: CBS domain-containing protein [Acidimicrobiales bacterium]|nr:CBS domain-containing protein [Acidimicrobiales bacterium]